MTEEIVLTRCLFLGGHIGPPLRLVLLFRVIVGADRRVCPLLFAVFNLPPPSGTPSCDEGESLHFLHLRFCKEEVSRSDGGDSAHFAVF